MQNNALLAICHDALIEIHPLPQIFSIYASSQKGHFGPKRPVLGLEVPPEVPPEVRPDVRPEVQPEVQPEVPPEVQLEVRLEVRPEMRSEMRSEVQSKVQSEIKSEIWSDCCSVYPWSCGFPFFKQLACWNNCIVCLPKRVTEGVIIQTKRNVE